MKSLPISRRTLQQEREAERLALIGRTAKLPLPSGLGITVTIKAVTMVYGRAIATVEPLHGEGVIRVNLSKLVLPSGAPSGR